MLKLLNIEFYKLFRRWLPYILLLALILLLVLTKVGAYSSYSSFMSRNPDAQLQPGATVITVTNTGSSGQPFPGSFHMESVNVGPLVLPGAMDSVLSTIAGMGALLAIILAAQVVGVEYGWGTLRQTLIKGVSRRKFLTAKFLALAITIVAGVLITVFAGFVIGMATTAMVQGGIDWGFMTGGYIGGLLADIAQVLFVIGIYLALTVLACVLLRSAGSGLAVGLGLYFVDAIVSGLAAGASGFIKELFRFGIGFNVQQFMASNAQILQETVRPMWQSGGILLAWGTLFVIAAFYFIRRQDLTA